MKVCDVAIMQGEIFDRKFLSDFIEIFRSTSEPVILETLLTSMNKIIKNFWKASTCPKGWIQFPVLSEEVQGKKPWLEFQFPTSDTQIHDIFVERGFTLSLWMNSVQPTKTHEIISMGNANAMLQLNFMNKKEFNIGQISHQHFVLKLTAGWRPEFC